MMNLPQQPPTMHVCWETALAAMWLSWGRVLRLSVKHHRSKIDRVSDDVINDQTTPRFPTPNLRVMT